MNEVYRVAFSLEVFPAIPPEMPKLHSRQRNRDIIGHLKATQTSHWLSIKIREKQVIITIQFG
jgi:hypothetical protein